MNVLWIQADELRADALGCYDWRWVPPKTPNIDALAKSGVKFTNTYCNSPVCVPSRTSMLTGRYPHELGVYHNEANVNGHTLPRDLVTFPQAFAAAGYETVTIGKTHTPRHPIWGRVVGPPHGKDSGYHRYMFGGEEPEQLVRVPGTPMIIVAGIYEETDGEPAPAEHLTQTALEWLDERKSTRDPWMLRVSYIEPHTPVLPPRRFAELFDPTEFPYDPSTDTFGDSMSPFGRFVGNFLRSWELSADQVQTARSHYWAQVSNFHEQVGRLVEKLDSMKTSPTLIILNSDHGVMLGEQGLWQKQMFYRPVHRIPHIISAPSLPVGQTRDDLNDLLDFGPTLMSLCGVPRPEGTRGRDLFGDAPEPEATFGVLGYGQPGSRLYPLLGSGPETPRRAAVRTKTHIYDTSVRIGGEDLAPDDPRRTPAFFDMQTDPYEMTNLTGSGDQSAEERRLADLLEEWLELDAGIVEPPLSA